MLGSALPFQFSLVTTATISEDFCLNGFSFFKMHWIYLLGFCFVYFGIDWLQVFVVVVVCLFFN